MSESTVKLLNNPYGQVTFNLFRLEEQAFVDKSLSICSLSLRRSEVIKDPLSVR